MPTFALTAIAMLAFAANSLLCRAALAQPQLDPYSFTTIRVLAGAIVLWVLVSLRPSRAVAEPHAAPPWRSAIALFGYALPFSLAYVALDTATGALILFGGVQTTMIIGGLIRGERPTARQWAGLFAAVGGLVYLVSPGVTAPDPTGATLMTIAGISWGLYSLLGKGAANPLKATQRNFAFAAPFAIAASLLAWRTFEISLGGATLAILSGALASGVGYAVWYSALRDLTATSAAVVQLCVPVLAGVGGVLLLNEQLTSRLLVASAVILGGIAVAVTGQRSQKP